MPDWDAAVDALTDIRHSYKTDEGIQYTASFLVDYGEKRGYGEDIMRTFAAAVIASAERAVPMWVGKDIVEMIDVASESFQPEPIYAEDLLVPNGFALLEQPIVVMDAKGKPTSWRGLTWSVAHAATPDEFAQAGSTLEEQLERLDKSAVGKPCVLISLYSHGEDDDYYNTSHQAEGYPPMMIGGSHLSLMHFAPMFFGDSYEGIPELERENIAPIQVLFRLAQQEIVMRSSERPGRHARKRSFRHGPEEIKTVQVLRLRRVRQPQDRDDEGEGINWTHRWLVGGHWRWQWYPSEERHKQIWIHPYVKGPEDKPLVAKDKVIDFSR